MNIAPYGLPIRRCRFVSWGFHPLAQQPIRRWAQLEIRRDALAGQQHRLLAVLLDEGRLAVQGLKPKFCGLPSLAASSSRRFGAMSQWPATWNLGLALKAVAGCMPRLPMPTTRTEYRVIRSDGVAE